MTTLNAILIGAISMALCVISLHMLQFWRRSRDRLFLGLAVAFVIEAIQRVIFGMTAAPDEDAPELYLLRLAAYAIILISILDKNRRSSR